MASAISSLEMRWVESVLEMESGYVLDFTDRKFAEFFEDLDVDINAPEYCADGSSKAKRLRRFLRATDPVVAGRALQALLDHRLASSGSPSQEDEQGYRNLVTRLLCSDAGSQDSAIRGSRDLNLSRHLDSEAFNQLGLEVRYADVLLRRMKEAEACLAAGGYLAAVILCGSVLEGLCLAFGQRHEERLKGGYHACFNRAPKKLEDWKLAEMITVLSHLGHLSPNIEKFGHALRDFRNYVHPGAELRNGFSINNHTALIGFQIVLAAVDDLAKSGTKE